MTFFSSESAIAEASLVNSGKTFNQQFCVNNSWKLNQVKTRILWKHGKVNSSSLRKQII